MKLTPKLHKAINLAASLHFGQNRKGIVVPYIIHPFSVTFIAANYTDDEDVLVSCVLHDVLEDCPNYSYEELVKDFGQNIADIVKEVSQETNFTHNTDQKKKTWLKRKTDYIENLKQASERALLVSAADKFHNLHSMLYDYKIQGDEFLNVFNSSVSQRMWYYDQVIQVLDSRLSNNIVSDLKLKYKQVAKAFTE